MNNLRTAPECDLCKEKTDLCWEMAAPRTDDSKACIGLELSKDQLCALVRRE